MLCVLCRLQVFVSQKAEAAAVMKRSFALPNVDAAKRPVDRWIKQCFGPLRSGMLAALLALSKARILGVVLKRGCLMLY